MDWVGRPADWALLLKARSKVPRFVGSFRSLTIGVSTIDLEAAEIRYLDGQFLFCHLLAQSARSVRSFMVFDRLRLLRNFGPSGVPISPLSELFLFKIPQNAKECPIADLQ